LNVVAAQTRSESGVSIIAPHCYADNTTGEIFENWFKHNLMFELEIGSVVIMDNASFHRKAKLREIASEHGFSLLFLPPYSPDYNPIEKAWANMKKRLHDILPVFRNLEEAVYACL
jgi:transposase